MTYEEAKAQSIKRWGNTAIIIEPRLPNEPYRVGYRQNDISHFLGDGSSWEEAFENADCAR